MISRRPECANFFNLVTLQLQSSVTKDGKKMLLTVLLQLETLPFNQQVPHLNRSSTPSSSWAMLEPLLLTEGENDRNSIVQLICDLA